MSIVFLPESPLFKININFSMLQIDFDFGMITAILI
jgi:hypothetical protein